MDAAPGIVLILVLILILERPAGKSFSKGRARRESIAIRSPFTNQALLLTRDVTCHLPLSTFRGSVIR
jgi:hypothetical protein